MSTSLTRLQSFYSALKAPLLLHATIRREFPGSVALLVSLQPHSALLLAMAAEIDPATPVLFDTPDGHAPEALAYARILSTQLGFTDVRWLNDTHALEEMGFLALITDRRRPGIPRIDLDENGVFRIHPLAGWSQEEQKSELLRRALPPHPLKGEAEEEGGEHELITPAAQTSWSV